MTCPKCKSENQTNQITHEEIIKFKMAFIKSYVQQQEGCKEDKRSCLFLSLVPISFVPLFILSAFAKDALIQILIVILSVLFSMLFISLAFIEQGKIIRRGMAEFNNQHPEYAKILAKAEGEKSCASKNS